MHPALSIVFFTTLSGAGYGLAALLALGLLDPVTLPARIAWLLALGMIAGGLVSSVFHLRNPQRGWRALSQWRSSWLSREGVMAILTFVPLLVVAYAAVVQGRHFLLPGLFGAAMSAATVYCTAMIYASIRAVEAWNTPLTPMTYLLFAGAGGALLSTFFAALGGGSFVSAALLSVGFLAAAWAAKLAWRNRLRRLRPRSTPETATGLGPIGRVRLFEPPHMTDNYLTREMGFRIARKHASKLFRIAFAAGLVLPVLLVLVGAVLWPRGGTGAVLLSVLALAGYGVGVFIERWLFFAEARHAVMNYY